MKEHAFYVGREGREVFWNIPLPAFEIILFALTGLALAIMAFGIYRRWLMWKAMGKPEIRLDDINERVKTVRRVAAPPGRRDPHVAINHRALAALQSVQPASSAGRPRHHTMPA